MPDDHHPDPTAAADLVEAWEPREVEPQRFAECVVTREAMTFTNGGAEFIVCETPVPVER
jgi:hypothetical protein